MWGASKTLEVTILTFLLLHPVSLVLSNSETTICVSNTTSSCQSLDEALHSVESDSILQLEPGTHVVQSNYNVSGKTNLTIIGNPADPSSVVIECDATYGLIFMEIQGLKMSGFTLTDCGFTGNRRVLSLFTSISRAIKLFFHPLYFFSTGILLFDIQDLVIENAVIKENEGFGMVAINIVGDSRFSEVDFMANFPNAQSVCNLEVTTDPGGSGGGLFLVYHDYINQSKNEQAENSSLIIKDGLVRDNYNCRRISFITQYNRLTKTLGSSFYQNMSIVGSGGITLSLGQTSYNVFTEFDNCTFSNNSGLSHMTALGLFLYNETERSKVTIQNSVFERNGGIFYNNMFAFPDNGLDPFGAVAILFFIPRPDNFDDTDHVSIQTLPDPAEVNITNCTFIENIAYSGAGVTVFSFTTTTGFVSDVLRIKDCSFHNNSGNFGSALFMTELSYSGFESNLNIIIDSIQVQNSILLAGSTQLFLSDTLSAVDISNVKVDFTGTNSFSQNRMTAVSTSNAILEISDFILFSGNSGVTGGALHMERESYLVLVNQAEVVFANNTATLSGGALYVDFRSIRASTFDCYLFLETIDIYCDVRNTCPTPGNRFVIKFLSNTAPLGSAVFGSNLFDCPWTKDGINILNVRQFTNLSSLDPNRLPVVFDPPTTGNGTTVNTFAVSITEMPETNCSSLLNTSIPVCDRSNSSCRINESYCYLDTETTQEVEPGQPFSIPLSAYDRLGHPVPLTIFSQINNPQATATISTSNRLLLAGGEERFTTVPLQVNGTQGDNYSVIITSNEALLFSQFTILVVLKNCSIGFKYNNNTRGCECDIDQYLDGVTCNPDGSISFPENQWIGVGEEGSYIRAPCIRDYCKIGVTSVNLSDPDTQCRNKRSGILCGRCDEGYSRITGASFCQPCDSNNYLALITIFALFGILLVVVLALFKVTITDGLINGFVFYANIFGVYTSTFLPLTSERGSVATLLISFLNFNFGVQSCFYVGMTELDLVGLTLIFPIYVMFILLVIYLIGTWVTHERVSHFYRQINVTHIFATLLFYCYANVMQTCVAVLAQLSVNIEQDRNVVRWGRDPNVQYGVGIHGFLVALSVVFLVVLIPLPIILFIPQISLRFRISRSFKPVIDAIIAPFSPKKSFWVSFRLVFRVVIYLVAAFGVTSEQLVAISFFIASLSLLQAYLKPYSSSSRNIIDMLLMFTLTLFSIIAIYLFNLPSTLEQKRITIMLVFAYIFTGMLLLLFAHYILKRFECTNKPYQKAINCLSTALEKMINFLQNPYCCCSRRERKGSLGTTSSDSTYANEVTHTSINLNEIGDSDVLREALLECDKEDSTAKYRPTPQKERLHKKL